MSKTNNKKINRIIKSTFLSLVLSATMFSNLNNVSLLFDQVSVSAIQPNFSLCGLQCTNLTTHYVGYNRTNRATLNGVDSILPPSADTIYPQSSNYRNIETSPNIDTQTVNGNNGEYADSIHRLDEIKVGSIRKSETQKVNTILPNSSTSATVKLIWGDTITITSNTLPVGTPVSMQLKQNGGGFGDPVSINAAYDVKMNTYIDGAADSDLSYQIVKVPGTNDYTEFGNFNGNSIITVAVGQKIKIESKLEATDQVFVGTENQILNGADSIDHKLNILTPNVSFTSASGLIMSEDNLTVTVPDSDGVNQIIESASPNLGDGNGDGIKDYLQGNVTSILDPISNKYITIAADPTSVCQSLNNVESLSETANQKQDINYSYPFGFLSFESPCNSTIKVKIYWHGQSTSQNLELRKYNQTNQNYIPVPNAAIAIENINNIPTLVTSYTVTDNGPLDQNPAVGSIKDPVGLSSIQQSGGGTITINNQSQPSNSILVTNSSIVTSSVVPTTPIESIIKTTAKDSTAPLDLSVLPSQLEKNSKKDNQTSNPISDNSNELISLARTGGNSNSFNSSFPILILVLLTYFALEIKRTS